MKVLVLCNDRLGIPALQQLLPSGLVKSVGTSDRQNENKALLQKLCAQSKNDLRIFSRDGFEEQLKSWLSEFTPDVVLVKTFPWKIPASCLHIPRSGFINFHYAPLPEWKGANPLFWMIKEKAVVCGVTVHRMDENFDAGPILLQQRVPLPADATFGMASTQLGHLGVHLTGQLLQGIMSNTLKPQEQEKNTGRWCGRPKPEDLQLDFEKMNAAQVVALVNACNPWNKGVPVKVAGGPLSGWLFGITEAEVIQETSDSVPGTILSLDKTSGLSISCAENTTIKVNVIYTEEGFYPGKALLGFGLQSGDILKRMI